MVALLAPQSRLLTVSLLVSLFAFVFASPASASSTNAEALVIRTASDDWKSWVTDLEVEGGRVLVAFPPDAFLIRGGAPLLNRLQSSGARVFRDTVPTGDASPRSATARLAVGAWNTRLAAAPLADIPPEVTPGEPDALASPDAAAKSAVAAQAGAPPGAGFYDTSEFLLGKVAVGIVLPESDGTIDINREDWTTQEITDVVAGILDALSFIAALDPNAEVSYYVAVYDSIATGYEPIRRGSWTTGEQSLWITECMDSLGFHSGDAFFRTRSFNNALRDSLGTDWGVTVFVVDSSVDTDGRFADGKYAYAYLGGPFVVMTYDNWTWGIANMNAVAAHEMMHPFYALDEYADGLCTSPSGYLGVQNQNQVNGGCALDVLCLYRTNLTGAFAADSVCWYTRGQIGWWDADGDSIPNILDTDPETALDAFPDTSETPTPTLTGTANVTMLTNVNPIGLGNEVSISHIAGVQYRIDGGSWANAAPLDGAWDEGTEAFTLTTGTLLEAPHTIEARATSDVGNADASFASDTFVVRDVTPPLPVTSFVAAARDTTIRLQWTGSATVDYQGVRIRYRTDAYPSDPADGLLLGDFPGVPSAVDSVLHAGVISDTLYYYAAFARDEVANFAVPDSALGTPLDPAPPSVLYAPAPGSLYASLSPQYIWAPSVPEPGDTIVAYWLQVASDSLFASPAVDAEVVTGAPADTFWTQLTTLATGSRYFARLRAKDASSGTYGFYSEPKSFTTRVPVDSIAWRPETLSPWTNFANAETLAASTNARLEVAFRPADPLGVGGHTGRVVFTTNAGAAWDSLPLVWDHAAGDTGFFRVTLTYNVHFKRFDRVAFRVEGWEPWTIATPKVDDGGYTFVGGPNPIGSFHVPTLAIPGPETMRDPLIGNILDTLYTFEVGATSGALAGAALRLRPAAGGPFVQHPANFTTSSSGNDFYVTNLDTVFASEDSLDYYFVLWGGSLYDTTYVAGDDDSSYVTLVAASAEAMPFEFRVGTLTAVGSVTSGLRRIHLRQNAPNPFTPRTVIPFEIAEGLGTRARLTVYDASGRLVRVLMDRVVPAGRHEIVWDGEGDRGAMASGVYMYELRAGGIREVRRMTLLR